MLLPPSLASAWRRLYNTGCGCCPRFCCCCRTGGAVSGTSQQQTSPIPVGVWVLVAALTTVILLGFVGRFNNDVGFDSAASSAATVLSPWTALSHKCPYVSPAYPHWFEDCNRNCSDGQQVRTVKLLVEPAKNPKLVGLIENMRNLLVDKAGPLDRLPAQLHVTLGYFCCLSSEEMAIVERVLQSTSALATLPPQVHLAPRVTCNRDSFDEASIIWMLVNEDQDRLLKLQESIEGEIQKHGISLTQLRRQQQPPHLTVASVRESRFNSVKGLHVLNRRLQQFEREEMLSSRPSVASVGTESFILPVQVSLPCQGNGQGACLGPDLVPKRLRNLRYGIDNPPDKPSTWDRSWEAFDWGVVGMTFKLCVTTAVLASISLPLLLTATPLTSSLAWITTVDMALVLAAWVCFELDMQPLKQLTLYLVSALTNVLCIVIYYLLHRSAHLGSNASATAASSAGVPAIAPAPGIVLLLYATLFVADYSWDVRHAITVFEILLTLFTIQVLRALKHQARTPIVVTSLLALESVLLSVFLLEWISWQLGWRPSLVWATQPASIAIIGSKSLVTGMYLARRSTDRGRGSESDGTATRDSNGSRQDFSARNGDANGPKTNQSLALVGVRP